MRRRRNAKKKKPKDDGPYQQPKYQGTKAFPQVLSFGGGVDSMCMLLDAMQRKELPDVVVFMDVGDPDRIDPAEWPETYTYLEEVVKPLLDKLGVKFVWMSTLMYPIRDARSLYEWFKARGQVPLSGPAHLCSVVAKVERFERWMQDYFEPGTKIDVWIGFAKGEEARAQRDPHGKKSETAKKKLKKGEKAPVERLNRFPLMERELSREDCIKLIAKAGYKVPRKSACVFCPYGERSEWEEFARRLPEQFRKIVGLEREKDLTVKGYKMYIHQFSKFGLTLPQHRVMQAMADGRREFKGAEGTTVETLQRRSWATPKNELTSYGSAILEEAGPGWGGPPISPKTGKPKSDGDTDLVERAAIGGCVRWNELQSEEEGYPTLGTYQVLELLDGGTIEWRKKPPKPKPKKPPKKPPKPPKVTHELVSHGRSLTGPEKATFTRLRKGGEFVTADGRITAAGRELLREHGPGYTGPPKKKICGAYQRKPILGIHYTGTAVESYAGFEEGDRCSTTTEEDALNQGLAGNIVPVSRLKVRPGEQARLFNPGDARYQQLKRRLMR